MKKYDILGSGLSMLGLPIMHVERLMKHGADQLYMLLMMSVARNPLQFIQRQ